MKPEFKLLPISKSYEDTALERAEHYRLLNWPDEAESICLDVLATTPDDQRAITILVLALTDQFLESGRAPRVNETLRWAAKITDEYQRTYMTGIVHEREARGHLRRGFHGSFAFEAFHDAIDWYTKAQSLAPPGNEEATLRHNSCVRTIDKEGLEPPAPEPEQLLE